MENKEQARLMFHGMDVVKVNFEAEKPFEESAQKDIVFDIQSKVFFPKKSSRDFKIVMTTHVSLPDYFSLEFNAIGHFQFTADLSAPIKKQYVDINGPAIMFPYVRSFISTFTSALGHVLGTLTIPTQFFSGELEEIEGFSADLLEE